MKRTSIFMAILCMATALTHAQVPQTFSYQAIARDTRGNLLGDRDLTIRIGILQDENLIWQEDHMVHTGNLGFFTVEIGGPDAQNTGGAVSSFGEIPWENGAVGLQVSVDAGSGFVELGSSMIHSVPYALYAADGPGGTGPQGPQGEQGPPGPPGPDEQQLSLDGVMLSISGGNSVDLTPAVEAGSGSGSGSEWDRDQDTLSTLSHVAIGSTQPNQSTLAVQGFNVHPDAPLFEVRREDGFPVFAVYNEGVVVYVDEQAKGVKGGFAVGGFSRNTKGIEQEYLRVTPDSVRIYIPEDLQAKGVKGGFAVGGFKRNAKGPGQDFLFVNPDSTRVYVPNQGNDPGYVGLQGGFAVNGYQEGAKGPSDYLMGINRGITRFNTSDNDRGFAIGSQGDGWGSNYLEMTPTNAFIGTDAGLHNREIDPWDENGWGLSSMNVFVGYQAGMYNEYGHHNTFMGFRAGTHTLGDWNDAELAAHNVFIGTQAGFKNIQGSYNAYMGCYAGFENLDGSGNVMIGSKAGYSGDHASGATMIGNNAGMSYNGDGAVTFLGYFAGFNARGEQNTYLGNNAGSYSETGTYNVAVGHRAGQYMDGDRNTIVGNDAGRGVGGSSSGSDNTLIGHNSGTFLTTGINNTFIGSNTGANAQGADGNTFVGFNAGASYTGGYSNTFVGSNSGVASTTGTGNVFLGTYSGRYNTIGEDNVYLGHSAGNSNSSGSRNVFLGFQAGYNETGSDQLYIDNSSTVDPLIWGSFASDYLIIYGDLQVNGTIYQVSDIDKKKNIRSLDHSLEKVMALNGVSFEWIRNDESKGAGEQAEESIGVIAQEVETVLPALVTEKRNGDKAVNYSGLIPVLLEAVKEQQGQIEALERRIAELEQ